MSERRPQRSLVPRRSALFTPGANLRALERSRQSAADVLILDLEDGVAPAAKSEARVNVGSYLEQRQADGREVVVRVNGLDTSWCDEDLSAVVGLEPDAILFPKMDTGHDVIRAEQMLTAAGASRQIQLWCMIETPLAILNLPALAAQAAAFASRMSVWVIGANDLVKGLRAAHTAERTPLLYALGAALTAARACGVAILDGVHNDLADMDGFAAACAQGRALGFDGKTLIHPAQIEVCNRAFSPDAQAVAQARKIIAAFARPENAGQGVLQLDGSMVELLHAEIARETIAIAEAIAAREAAAPGAG